MHPRKDPVYDPSRDQQLLRVGGTRDSAGTSHDVHETLFLSESSGFYLQRRIRQVRRGRTWETVASGPRDGCTRSGNFRFLKVLHPMSRAQVIRYVVDSYMPREGGLHLATHLALDHAGIPES